MNIIKVICDFVALKIEYLIASAKMRDINKKIGGGHRIITYPYVVAGSKNILMEEPSSMGPGATIYTTEAKLIIKKHFIAGPNLTIITGDHKYQPERWLDSITVAEKDPENDKDVVIEEDVWCGANVTILKGVVIGRSSIIAAGAVVTKSVPPYSIVAGIPAKVIGKKWGDDDIERHNKFIDRETE